MATFEALRLIRLKRAELPDVDLTTLLNVVQHVQADGANHDFEAALALDNMVAIEAESVESVDFYRLCIEACILIHRPLWVRTIPYGRKSFVQKLERDAAQCFEASGLMDDPPTPEIIEWWDSVAGKTRSATDIEKMRQARAAEKLRLEFERKRLAQLGIDREPIWMAIDDNWAGYDNHDDLTDIAHYWYVAEDRILRDAEIGRPVNIIVHSLDEVNQSLKRGEYFWVDIARDGIILYELPCHPLATPMPLTPADAYNMADRYFGEWLPSIDRALSTAADQVGKGADDLGWRKDAAFTLNQAVERAYICFLLVRTLYFPRSHNIKFLRSLAEDSEPRLIDAWPRERRIDRRRFQLLKRAYVEARYSTAYEIGVEELNAILECVRTLRDIVEQVSRERLDLLRDAIAQ